jgi:hypothetical protein
MSYLVLAYKWCVNGPINFWLRLRCKYFLNFIIEWRVVFLWWFGCKKLWVHGYLIRTILEKFNFVLCFFMVQLLRIWLLLVITKKINKKKQTIMCGCHGFFFFFWVWQKSVYVFKEAYEEFKHVLLAFIYDKDDQNSPVANEVSFIWFYAQDVSWWPFPLFPCDFICVKWPFFRK